MALKLSLSSVAPERARADVLVVGVYKAPGGASTASGGGGVRKLTPTAQALDKLLGGSVAREAADADFKGNLGGSWLVNAGDGVQAKSVLLVGLGKRDELTVDRVRRAGAAAVNKVRGRRTAAVARVDAVPDGIDPSDAVGALAEGLLLGGYSFQRYKTKSEAPALSS